MSDWIYDPNKNISIAVEIATYKAYPYVHLSLEVLRVYCPSVKIFLYDDLSPNGESEKLHSLAKQYNADFCLPSTHIGSYMGDLTGFYAGCLWAYKNKFDILVKFSRRFIALNSWVDGLKRLALLSQGATFSNISRWFGFGFRTDCLAIHLKSWFESGVMDKLEHHVFYGGNVFMEKFIHELAIEVSKSGCPLYQRFSRLNPSLSDESGYVRWPMMGEHSGKREPGIMQYMACTLDDYAEAAKSLKLPYQASDFHLEKNALSAPA